MEQINHDIIEMFNDLNGVLRSCWAETEDYFYEASVEDPLGYLELMIEQEAEQAKVQ